MLYVKESIVHTPVEQLNMHEFEESVWCELELNVGKLLLGVCYRSTASDPENNDRLLHLLRQASLVAERSHLLIMGDFNYPEINYEDYEVKAACTSDAAKFFDQTQDLFLHQHVNECTRYRLGQKPSILDYIFTGEENLVDNVVYQAPVGKSDHCCLEFDYVDRVVEDSKPGLRRNYWKGDYTSIVAELANVNWDELLHDMDTEETWNCIRGIVSNMSAKHIPVQPTDKQQSKKRKKKEWIKKSTVKEIKNREATWKKYRDTGSQQN